MKTVTIPVAGMSCSGCIQSIERAVGAVSGVKQAKATLQPPQVVVDFDADLATREDLEQAVVDAGYDVPALTNTDVISSVLPLFVIFALAFGGGIASAHVSRAALFDTSFFGDSGFFGDSAAWTDTGTGDTGMGPDTSGSVTDTGSPSDSGDTWQADTWSVYDTAVSGSTASDLAGETGGCQGCSTAHGTVGQPMSAGGAVLAAGVGGVLLGRRRRV